MHLEQNGDLLSGTMQEISSADPNQYAILRITGRLHGDSIQLSDLSMISENSPKNIRWCRKIRHGIIYRNNEGMRMEGNWENDGNYLFKKTKLKIDPDHPCLPGSFVLYRKNPVDSNIAKPKADSSFTVPSPLPKDILSRAAERKEVIMQKIHVSSDSVRLQFYDNGDIDWDTITVIYNGRVLLSHKGLTADPFEFWIKVAPGSENKLLMFAENEGSIPPNTALLILYDRGKQQVIRLEADGKTNGVVNILRE